MSGEHGAHDHPVDLLGVARAGVPGDRVLAGTAAQLPRVADDECVLAPESLAPQAHGEGGAR